ARWAGKRIHSVEPSGCLFGDVRGEPRPPWRGWRLRVQEALLRCSRHASACGAIALPVATCSGGALHARRRVGQPRCPRGGRTYATKPQQKKTTTHTRASGVWKGHRGWSFTPRSHAVTVDALLEIRVGAEGASMSGRGPDAPPTPKRTKGKNEKRR
ncbi:uncharacterized protein Tco025E_02967, partial [Trypanosoma conorhini]